MKWKALLRDALIILGLTFIGGFVVGLAGPSDHGRRLLAVMTSNLLFTTIGFTISGAVVKTERFKHLINVAIAVWLVSLVNVVLGFATFLQWLFGLVFILIAMCIGGGLSFLFAKKPNPTTVDPG